MNNILITGATGFVGKELVSLLRDHFNIYRVIRRSEDKEYDNDIIISNIDQNTDWDGLFDNIDVVIHLAAKVHDMTFVEDNDVNNAYYRINYEGTKRIVDAAGKSGVKKIIFISTIKVNGESEENVTFAENDTPKPQGSYAISKNLAEKYIISSSKKMGFKYVIIRPTLIFGTNVKGNIHKLMSLVSKGLPFPYFSKENKRSMIGLKNLCSFISFSINSTKCNNNIIIVAEKDPISTKQLVQQIITFMGRRNLLLKIPNIFKSFGNRIPILNKIFSRLYGDMLVDNSKLYNTIGWNPTYTINEQIEDMVNNFKQRNN